MDYTRGWALESKDDGGQQVILYKSSPLWNLIDIVVLYFLPPGIRFRILNSKTWRRLEESFVVTLYVFPIDAEDAEHLSDVGLIDGQS